MKLLNKITSLIMAIIMLITGTPVLQASDFTDLDMVELNELKKEISISVKESVNFKKDKEIYEGIPSLKELKKRYKEAVKNYEKSFQEFSESATKQDIKEAEQYIEYKKRDAEILAETDSSYDGFESLEEKQSIAFFDLLYKDLEQGEKAEELGRKTKSYYRYTVSAFTFTGAALGFLAEIVTTLLITVETSWGKALAFVGIGAIIGLITGLVFTPSYRVPTFSTSEIMGPSITIEWQFLESPFEYLAVLNKRGADDFATLYKVCPTVLWDVIDIEWYVSRNMTIENMKYRIYTRTTEWQNLANDKKAEYIHNLAERLRTEGK